jgi:hypothetical protein
MFLFMQSGSIAQNIQKRTLLLNSLKEEKNSTGTSEFM